MASPKADENGYCWDHPRERAATCTAIHYTPEQAQALVRAMLAHPDAKKAEGGRAVPASLL